MKRLTMRRAAVASLACLVLAGGALAAVGAAPPARRLTLTIYNDGSALIEDTRPLDLRSGEQDVDWPGIPVTIDASSVHLSSAKDDLRLLQQSYRYDLAEAGRAMELVKGKTVVCFTAEGKRYEGTLWSWDGGAVTLQTPEGLVIVEQARLASIETPLPDRPLTTVPTLSWKLWAATGGASDVTAAYLANGLAWHAEYVLVTGAKGGSGRLSGAASVENTSGSDFPDAQVRLVAGGVHRIAPPRLGSAADGIMMKAMAASGDFDAPEQATESAVGEYHMYSLTRRVTLPEKETRQVALFDDASVTPKSIYRYNAQRNASAIVTELALTNDAKNGLGMPLPAGRVRVYGPAEGGLALLGEHQTGHVAKGDTMRVVVGVPFDLGVTRDQISSRRLSDRETEQTWRATFRNRKSEAVTILWDEPLNGDWTITHSSLPYAEKDAHSVEFTVKVPAGEEVPVSYTVRWTY